MHKKQYLVDMFKEEVYEYRERRREPIVEN